MTDASARSFNRRQAATALADAAAGLAAWPALAREAAREAGPGPGPGSSASASPGSGDIVIGQSAHLSGPLAPTLKAVLRGQDMALAEFNRKGGVGGRSVSLVTLDDAYDAQKTVSNVKELLARPDVVALFGLTNTAGIAAALPLVAEKKVPLVGVYSGSPVLRARHNPYFFTTMASYRDEVVQMVRNLVTLHQSEIGLVYQNSPFGQLMAPVVEESCKALGATLVAKVPLEVSGSDAVAAVNVLAAAKPRALIFMSFGPSMVPFVKAARQRIAAPIYCVSIANSRALIEALGDEARGLAIAQIVPYPFRATSALTRNYHAAMASADLPVDYDHFFGYLNFTVLLEGLKRAGKGVTPQKLAASMESMRLLDIGGYTVDYSPENHHGSKFVELVMVAPGGKYLR
ncbi:MULTISPECIES: ABC transporter substrate-binding protein [unclassified Variovorax]|uniref:ABC transporter substrate-binding protein n=1 Tax=unclassified Variovorax TaxID=663243 RepID=UPI0008BC79CF|nr:MULTISPECIES: ABC transporter substrate-binding protein [unclassified Variovorax]SEK16757.1 ABC-type branched-chain amino acid transport system, substrate-binding protein [Variovorax sp. OK202]SFE58348.1 ABC-type branched-chain amino acid transport system, substrate-binding protein [Variovorax sp. OK212]